MGRLLFEWTFELMGIQAVEQNTSLGRRKIRSAEREVRFQTWCAVSSKSGFGSRMVRQVFCRA